MFLSTHKIIIFIKYVTVAEVMTNLKLCCKMETIEKVKVERGSTITSKHKLQLRSFSDFIIDCTLYSEHHCEIFVQVSLSVTIR